MGPVTLFIPAHVYIYSSALFIAVEVLYLGNLIGSSIKTDASTFSIWVL